MRPPRAGFWIRLFAWLRGGEVVWIIDFQGDVKASIAQVNAFGGAWCHVYWFNKIGRCQLNPDGKVDRRSESFYVHEWMRDSELRKQPAGEGEK
jgi:hypothetical protein